jgi:membrane protease YdiL (CAAX protease family)
MTAPLRRSLPPWALPVERAFRLMLVDKVPRDHHQSDSEFRRRRVVAVIVLIGGATLLGLSLSARPGDPKFYAWTTGLAVWWVVGGLASGPLHLGWIDLRGTRRRPIITAFALGLAVSVIFVIGSLVVREIGPLHDYVATILAHANKGSLPLVTAVTVINGIGEEVFFRGALFAAIGSKRPVVISTVIYAIVTIATANPMLVFAAFTLGFVFALQRRASGGILASSITHITWSVTMLYALPPLFH